VAKKVSDRQWQIFQAAVVRNKPVAGICKALEVTENQVYIARNRVGKIYNAELDSVGREIGKDLRQYKIPKAKKRKPLQSRKGWHEGCGLFCYGCVIQQGCRGRSRRERGRVLAMRQGTIGSSGA
jgi:hypothetical protein